MKIFYLLFLALSSLNTLAQEIIFSPVIQKDNEANYLNYNILGKIGENYCILKRITKTDNRLAIYDASMRLISNNRLKMIPANAWILAAIKHNDYLILFYEYFTKDAVYLKGVCLDSYGRQLNETITLDETKLAVPVSIEDNPRPTDTVQHYVSASENRQYILTTKKTKDNDTLKLSTTVWTPSLQKITKQAFELPVNWKAETFTLPVIDNNGTFILTKSTVSANILVTNLQLISKHLQDDEIRTIHFPLSGFQIAELRIDIDNVNKRYLFNALFMKRNTTDVEGLFTAAIDAVGQPDITLKFNPFSDALRGTINRDTVMRDAFNFLTIQKVSIKKDGTFLLSAEEVSSVFEGRDKGDGLIPDPASKWDTNPTVQPPTPLNADVNPHLAAFNPPPAIDITRQPPIYSKSKVSNFTNSIIIAEVDSLLNLTWNTVITKVQVGEQKYMSFGNLEGGTRTSFLFSGFQTPSVINNYSVLSNGDFIKNNTLKTLESDRILMPRGLVQVGLQKAIIPATYRRRIVFALVDFSKPFKMIY